MATPFQVLPDLWRLFFANFITFESEGQETWNQDQNFCLIFAIFLDYRTIRWKCPFHTCDANVFGQLYSFDENLLNANATSLWLNTVKSYKKAKPPEQPRERHLTGFPQLYMVDRWPLQEANKKNPSAAAACVAMWLALES